MLNLDEEVIQKMIEKSEEFRKLFEEHIKYEQDLEAISSLKFYPPEVEARIKEIKKVKLKGKDRMYQLIAEYGFKY
jgi:uncharacterized protein YdcH (DUF465 family)